MMDEPCSFFDGKELVHGQTFKFIRDAAGPVDLEPINSCCQPETEMDTQIVLRNIAAAALDLGDLLPAGRHDLDTGADPVAV